MTDAESITLWLTELRDCAQRNLRLLKAPPMYAGTGDFLLQHGKWYTPRPLPPEYERGPLHGCFPNSAGAAIRYGLRYVEGYSHNAILPVHHGWCVDENDQVYEFTWNEPGTAYFGVVLNPTRVQYGAVFGNERNIDIYLKKFKPEGGAYAKVKARKST